VLGQQSGPEATATKGHLRRSEAARSWARSLLDSLEQFYENGSVPAIPEGERGRRAAAVPAAREPRDRSSFGAGFFGSLGAMTGVIAAGIALLVLFAVLIWPIGVLTGNDDEKSAAASKPSTTTAAQSANSGKPAGIAIVVERNGKKQLLVQAARLAPSGQSEGYYVWLYNSPSDAKSLGGQVTDQKGNYQAIGSLPADFQNYKYIDVSRQRIAKNATVKHSGDSVLRGAMPTLKKSTAKAGQPAALGQTILQPPA
jgi:hypothetical protein